MSLFTVETPRNYEQKCLCVLVLDRSGSMSGRAIQELNSAIEQFKLEVQEDFNASNRLEIGIISYSSDATVEQEPCLVDDMGSIHLDADGGTDTAEAIELALRMIQNRKEYYNASGQKYYRPWVVLLTDGQSTSESDDMKRVKKEIAMGLQNKSFLFYPVGVDGANMAELNSLVAPYSTAMSLKGLKFVEFFKWLSNSMAMVTASKEGQVLQLPAASSWSSIEV